MNVNLQVLEAGFPDYQLPLFGLLRATLEYPAATELKAAKLAEDVKFICQAGEQPEDGSKTNGRSGKLWDVWEVLFAMARLTPPNHPWQDCMVLALDRLRRQEGRATGMGDQVWKDLPELHLFLCDIWDDLDPEMADEQWKNQHSFTARISSPEFALGLNFGMYALREALEEPRGNWSERDVWVVCEWLIRCPGVFFQEMVTDVDESHFGGKGSLCPADTPAFSVKRWEFWRKQLGQIAADAEKLELSNATVERIPEAIASMDAAEKEWASKGDSKTV
ncbi:hypothetical protein GGR56DRAFT_629840 [Xylariaceae sp. FL0804]|nr:hypothetical protein GGR56DRAFT_629840 [Xylariaceae sp. FL0804]